MEPEPSAPNEPTELPTQVEAIGPCVRPDTPAIVTSPLCCDIPDSLFESLFDATCCTPSIDEPAELTAQSTIEPRPESHSTELESATDLHESVENVSVSHEQAAVVAPPETPTAPTVLVADDSPTVRKLMSATLRTHGFDVIEAIDGIDAVRALSERQPDLILLDINMPKLDGFQLCRLVKKHAATRHIPVLMLSGKQDATDRAKGQLVGCSAYFTKPFDPDQIVAAITQQLATRTTVL